MAVILSRETEKMIEERPPEFCDTSADEFVQAAIRNYLEMRGPDIEDLDEETQAAIAEGLAQLDRGERIPHADVEAFARSLREKNG
jgi:predicted transcriptional regulator